MSGTDLSLILQQRIAERRRRRDDNDTRVTLINRENEILDAEIRAWEEALTLFTEGVDKINPTHPSVALGKSDARYAATRHPGTPDGRRGPKGVWGDIMPEMVRQYPVGVFKLDDVEAAGDMVGHRVARATARSQMANYVNHGWLERVDLGEFKFTASGLSVLGTPTFAPGNERSPDVKTPAMCDAQSAGVSQDGVPSADPEASNGLHSTGGISPR